MSRIRAENTKPEKVVRSIIHCNGYRFRIHKKDIIGKPDIVLVKHKKIIFVDGCYWHRHKGCKNATTPKTNTVKWLKKFEDNVNRDKLVNEALIQEGWNILRIWECETENVNLLNDKLTNFLES